MKLLGKFTCAQCILISLGNFLRLKTKLPKPQFHNYTKVNKN